MLGREASNRIGHEHSGADQPHPSCKHQRRNQGGPDASTRTPRKATCRDAVKPTGKHEVRTLTSALAADRRPFPHQRQSRPPCRLPTPPTRYRRRADLGAGGAIQPGFRHILVCAMPTTFPRGRTRARLPEPLDTAGPSFGSRAGDLIQTDVGENSQVDAGLPGYWGQHVHPTLQRDGMANVILSRGIGPENTATRQLHL